MAKCISCRKPDINEIPAVPMSDCVELYEIFDGIWYCEECCEKFKLDVPKRSLPTTWDFN